MNRKFLISGAAFGGIAVALGAFGAHGLKDILTEERLHAFHTGVEYQFYHSLALLITGLIWEKMPGTSLRWTGYLFISGILLFSGSLYCLSTVPALSWLGIITPFGGLCFIAAWVLLIVSLLKK